MSTESFESPQDEDPLDERFVARLAAFDETLAEGKLSPHSTSSEDDAVFGDRLRQAQTILSLLEQHRRLTLSRSRNDGSVPHIPGHFTFDPTTGQGMVGRFQLLRELGRGGGGIVFLAQDPLLKREVALKVPTLHRLLDENERRRFLREAQAAAGLDHPNIVPIFDSGEAGGIGWIASAYCPGPTLTQWLRQQQAPVSPRVAAQLTAVLADALEYMHRHGILHRDLKPGNVMLVTRESTTSAPEAASSNPVFDWPWIPKITDFGLARLMEETEHRTSQGTVVGTAAYMSVEQALGKTHDLGPTTDVYSLGAILYELLTNQPPFQGATQLDMLRQVVEKEPVPPRQVRADTPRDLEVICLKCLQKSPGDRYPSAKELADDLRRYLRGEPIHARPGTWLEHSVKWMKRQPATAMLIALAFLASLAGTAGIIIYNLETDRLHADRAEALSREKEASLTLDEHLRNLEQSEFKIRRQLFLHQFAKMIEGWEGAPLWRKLKALDSLRPLPGEMDVRGMEWHITAQRTRGSSRLGRHLDHIDNLAFSTDGSTLASASRDHSIRLWDPVTAKPLGILTGHTAEVWRVAFSPNGQLLASASQDRTVKLWDLATLRERATLRGHELAVEDVVFIPDSRMLISAGDDGKICLWNVASGEASLSWKAHDSDIQRLTLASDGQTLASAGRDATIRIWDLKSIRSTGTVTESAVLQGHNSSISGITFSPNGKILASLSAEGIYLWDVGEKKQIARISPPNLHGYAVAISPDGKILAAQGNTGTIRMWELETLKELPGIEEKTIGMIHTIVFSPDGRRLAFGGDQNVFAIKDLSQLTSPEAPSHSKMAWCLSFGLDGCTLASGGEDRLVKLWDIESKALVASLGPHDRSVHALAHSPDGKLLAVGSTGATVEIWDLARSVKRFTLSGHTERVQSVAFTPDGKTLASGSWDGTVKLWDLNQGTLRTTLEGHTDPIWSIAYSPDQRLLASAGDDHTIKIWDATSHRLLHTMRDLHKVRCLKFTPDGKWLLSSNVKGLVQLWNPETGEPLDSIDCHSLGIRSMAVSPDGLTLVTGSTDKSIKFWDLISRQEIFAVEAPHEVMSVAYSADGNTLAIACYDGSVTIWCVEPD